MYGFVPFYWMESPRYFLARSYTSYPFLKAEVHHLQMNLTITSLMVDIWNWGGKAWALVTFHEAAMAQLGAF